MADITYYAYFLKNFNNYFNRIIKTYSTIAEYIAAAEDYFLFSKPINYNPNDNVSTELVMNNCPFEADYVLITSQGEIVSRWFILETIYTRNKQKLYKLRRDLISDYKESLMNSPMFVQKAYLPETDSFIVNDEGMNFNQVKTAETLLKDRTNSAWIVGYIAKNAAATDTTVQVADENFNFITISDLAAACGINESDLVSILNIDGGGNTPVEAYFNTEINFRYAPYYDAVPQLGGGTRVTNLVMKPDLTAPKSAQEILNYNWLDTLWTVPLNSDAFRNRVPYYLAPAIVNNKAAILAELPTIFNRKYFTEAQLNKLLQYNFRIVKYNGIYYRLTIGDAGTKEDIFGPYVYTQWTSISAAILEASSVMGLTPSTTGHIFIRPKARKTLVNLETISAESGIIPAVEVKISSSRAVVENQAFDMFCIPYGPAKFVSDLGNQEAIADYALTLGAAIAVQLDSKLYDLQLLPYCPLIDNFNASNRIDLTALSENVDFNYINKSNSRIRETKRSYNGRITENPDIPGQYIFTATITISGKDPAEILDYGYTIEGDAQDIYSITTDKTASGSDTILSLSGVVSDRDADLAAVFWYEYAGTEHVSFLLWARRASFSTQLEYPLSLTNNMKIESQCNFYRLVSPNYQGSFEFNLAKNGGSSAYFIAECTYKPYTPYLKIAPQFNFLYGSNFGDNRGLICGGDFSLPRFTSAWETYLLNNKNYQNIFNRDIQNLNLEQKLERERQAITGALGIGAAGVVGGVAGAQAGGIYGAIAGAVVGTAGSGFGFAYDMDVLGQRQREARSMAVDKYNYSLGNIKALPYTLTKVGAFDINSKIWPFLEFYTATDEEKTALEQKIYYESMTVMRIDIIGRYMDAYTEPHYLKGELIRNEEIAEDNHIFEAIYTEFVKGVYC